MIKTRYIGFDIYLQDSIIPEIISPCRVVIHDASEVVAMPLCLPSSKVHRLLVRPKETYE